MSLNHNLTGCDRHTAAHPAVTVRLMTYIGIPTYLQPVRSKKPRKAAAGQKEMLLPISDKRTAKEDKKRVEKPTPAHARKRA